MRRFEESQIDLENFIRYHLPWLGETPVWEDT